MDHVAPIVATVADAAIVLEVMAGRPLSGAGTDPGFVVGVPGAGFADCDPAIAAVAEAAIERLAAAGAGGRVVALTGPTAPTWTWPTPPGSS